MMLIRRLFRGLAMGSTAIFCGVAAAQEPGFELTAEAPPPGWVQPKPEDGAEALLNPPAMVWPNDDRVSLYRVEMSRKEDFSARVLAYDGIDLNAFNGPDLLAEGVWYWRYTGTTADGVISAPSPVKQFVITDRSLPFPVPATADILAAMPDHPRLFTTPDTLAAFRARSEGPARDAWDVIRKSADALLDVSLPEHDLAPYTEPSKARGTVAMLKDGAYWRASSLDAREFNRAATHARNLAFAYLISGNVAYGDAAAKWIDYLAQLRVDPLKADRSSHDTVVYAVEGGLKNLGLAYDHAYDRLPPDVRRRTVAAIEFQLEAAIEWVRDDINLAQRYLNSHGQQCMHMSFTAALAIAKDSEKANEWCDWLIRQYVNRVAWLGDDGGYFEGQTYGHKLRYIMEALVPLRTATGLDVYRQPHVFNSGVFWLYAMSLNYWYEHWGDVYSLLMPWGNGADTYLSALLAAMSENRYVRWWSETVYATEVQIPLQYLSETGLKARAPVDIPQAEDFPDTGVITAYDRFYDHLATRLFFRSSPWGSQSHAHCDQNMFVIHSQGEILAADVGYYTYYGDRYHREFTRATPAHNTLEVGGKGQPKSGDATGRIARFFNTPRCVYLTGSAAEAYPNLLTRFDRHILYVRPGVFLLFDDVETAVDEPVQWLLNTFQKADIDEDARTITVPQQHMRLRIEHLMPGVLRYSQNNDRPAPIHEPGKRFSRVTERFPQAWHIEAEAPASPRPKFLALMSTYEAARGNPISELITVDTTAAVGAEFVYGGSAYSALVRPSAAPALRADDVDSDALAVLLQRDDNEAVQSWMAAEATRLQAGGTVLLADAGEKGSFSAVYHAAAAKAVYTVRARAGQGVSLYLPDQPETVLAFPVHDARQAAPLPFSWRDGMLTIALPVGREFTVYADPVVSPADMPETTVLTVRTGEEVWTATLELGVAEDGRWVAFDRVSPRRDGVYRFSCADADVEFLLQDRWDIRRSSRGRGTVEGLWREGAELFVHLSPGAAIPEIRAELVRPASLAERNLLRNGGFEEGIPEYPPRGWTIRHRRDDALSWPEWVQEGALEGDSCVRFVRPQKEMGLHAQPLKTLHAGSYVLSFATRGQATCGSVQIAGQRRDIEPSEDWTRHEIPVELEKGLVQVAFWMHRGEPDDQVLWIDDVRLMPAD